MAPTFRGGSHLAYLPVPIFSGVLSLTKPFKCPHAFYVNLAVTITTNIHITAKEFTLFVPTLVLALTSLSRINTSHTFS